MANKILTLSLLIVGIINFLPIVGIFGIKSLESAYQIKLSSSDLLILMQHRAVLFGLLGGFIIFSCFNAHYQAAAMLMAAISMIAYAALVHINGTENQAILKVLYLDYIGLFFLAVATISKYGFTSH